LSFERFSALRGSGSQLPTITSLQVMGGLVIVHSQLEHNGIQHFIAAYLTSH